MRMTGGTMPRTSLFATVLAVTARGRTEAWPRETPLYHRLWLGVRGMAKAQEVPLCTAPATENALLGGFGRALLARLAAAAAGASSAAAAVVMIALMPMTTRVKR